MTRTGLTGRYDSEADASLTAKMENMGKLHVELGELVGEMPAIVLIVEHLEGIPDNECISP